MIRKFAFVRSTGERLELNDPRLVFLQNPQGLGVEFKRDVYPITDGFFVAPPNVLNQLPFNGDLIFIDDGTAYERYRSVMRWILQSEDLKLSYQPTGGETFYKDIKLRSVGKSEIKEAALTCPVTFDVLTPWHRLSEHRMPIQFNKDSTRGKRYSYRYTYQYILDGGSGEVVFTGYGQLASSIEILLHGKMINPKITVRDMDTDTVLTIFNLDGLTVANNSDLFISTVPTRQGVWVDDASVLNKLELYDGLELFPQLKAGNKVKVSVEVSGSNPSHDGLIKVYTYFYTL